MALRRLPKPNRSDEGFSFFPSAEKQTPTKPVGLIADILNNDSIDFYRAKGHTATDYLIHVSDLIQVNSTRKFCPRQRALSLFEKRDDTNYRKIPPGMRLLHALGHAAQSHITNEFIARSANRDKVWGNWRCRCGQFAVHFKFKSEVAAEKCHVCKQAPEIYEEISITWHDYNITGHPDLIIVWNGILHIYEIKTIDRQGVDFDAMEAPLGDHTLQGSMYYWIIRSIIERETAQLAEHPGAFNRSIPFDIDPFVNYIYVDRSNKNLFKRIFYKEFVKRASNMERITPMLDLAQSLRDSLKTKILPPRLDVCGGPNSPRAKNCHCALSCFNRTRNIIRA